MVSTRRMSPFLYSKLWLSMLAANLYLTSFGIMAKDEISPLIIGKSTFNEVIKNHPPPDVIARNVGKLSVIYRQDRPL